MQQLYATWRMDYITAPKPEGEGCIFCSFPAERRDEERFILHRGEACYVIINLYPDTTRIIALLPFIPRESLLFP